MGHRAHAVDIQAPPEDVYRLYTDPARIGEWQSGVRGVTATGSPDQPGTRVTIEYGRPFTVHAEVLAAVPGRRHEQRVRELLGLVTCTTVARFEPLGQGTRATFEFDYRVKGGPLGRLFDGLVGGEIAGRFTKDADGLKRVAEHEVAPGVDAPSG
jgi:uncharacterized protein YndB with AHSA1/START domain